MSENFDTWEDFEKELNLSPEEESRINFQTTLLKATIEARKKANLTQEQLSKKTGIKQSAIARLESGKQSPNTDTLFKILEAVGYTLEIVPLKKIK